MNFFCDNITINLTSMLKMQSHYIVSKQRQPTISVKSAFKKLTCLLVVER